MRAVIISGGNISDYEYIKSKISHDDFIICADHGYDHAMAMGIVPNLTVGDFDSISKVPIGVPIQRFPSAKDKTDTAIALDCARARRYDDFLILGATGGRCDHMLANILLMRDCLLRGEKVIIADEFCTLMITNSYITLDCKIESVVSLIAITDCTGVNTHNLYYPLCDATLCPGDSLGISNVVSELGATVSVESGILLVICVNRLKI